MNTELDINNTSPAKASLTPWLAVWTAPRRTIRGFLDSGNPRRNMIWLSMAAGFLSALGRASSKNFGDEMSLPTIFLMSIPVGIVVGLFTLYVGSFLLKIIGGWLGGRGSRAELQTALARGMFMPAVLLGLLWIPEVLFLGKEMFTSEMPTLESNIAALVVYFTCVVLELVFGVWGLVITMKAIGEAHRFSAWKALLTCVMPFLILLVLFFLVMLMVQ
ncbi:MULTISPECIES: Yip1 family protein [unclassified Paenibacillus]|uniref:Yip1 family protein n=1 Tax=unclassified Paenibacillus TaxID=185978 RepID=UPI003683EEBD